jgi:hypothetical protein
MWKVSTITQVVTLAQAVVVLAPMRQAATSAKKDRNLERVVLMVDERRYISLKA